MPLAEHCLLLFNGDSWAKQTGLHAVHRVVLVWLWQHAILWLLSIFTTQSLHLDLWHTCCLTQPANTAHWQSVCFVGQILFLLLICSITVSISPRLLLGHFSPPLLIFSFGNRPALFPGRMSWKATKSGFSFFCLFCVVVHFFWLVNECFCCVWFIFVHTKPRDWLGKRLRNDLFCVECDLKPHLSQSINPREATGYEVNLCWLCVCDSSLTAVYLRKVLLVVVWLSST